MFLKKFFIKTPLGLRVSSRSFSHAVPAATHDDHHAAAAHGHGGHGHAKEYDWRDDPKVNQELEEDIRDRGWNPEEYTFPYSGKMQWYQVFPDNYDASNLSLNFLAERKKNDNPVQPMRVLIYSLIYIFV